MTAHVERTTAEIAAEEEFILHGEGGESDIRSHIGLLADRMAELRRQLNTAVSTEAVSYTHLDVYKRQSLKRPLYRQGQEFSFFDTKLSQQGTTLNAVSYTHLDVYKRQEDLIQQHPAKESAKD